MLIYFELTPNNLPSGKVFDGRRQTDRRVRSGTKLSEGTSSSSRRFRQRRSRAEANTLREVGARFGQKARPREGQTIWRDHSLGHQAGGDNRLFHISSSKKWTLIHSIHHTAFRSTLGHGAPEVGRDGIQGIPEAERRRGDNTITKL